jgi:hypothetical protein
MTTTSSATVSSFSVAAGTIISFTPSGAGVKVAAACSKEFAICSRICFSSNVRFGFLVSCLAISQRPIPTLTAMRTMNAVPTRSAILRPCSVTSDRGGNKTSRESPRIPAWIWRATASSRCNCLSDINRSSSAVRSATGNLPSR